MTRGLCWCLLTATVAAAALAHIGAEGRDPLPGESPLLQRFLANPDPSPTEYRALRHLEARNDHFDSAAWMDVWTEAAGASGFRYEVAAEGGSEYIRDHVFRETLEMERRVWSSGASDRAAVTPANYAFADHAGDADGLASLVVRPRRKDMLLVDGFIFLRPEDGELVRIEGSLSKPPSFWTRHVHITRWYQRFAGVRMPTVLQSVANVLIAGRSTFEMRYDYESVNGQHVGDPKPHR